MTHSNVVRWLPGYDEGCDDESVQLNPPDCWPPDPQVLDAFDAAALVVDVRGRIVHANAIADHLYSGPDGKLAGRDLIVSLVQQDDQVAVAAAVSQVLDGASCKVHLDLSRGDRSRHKAEVRCSPLWRDGTVVGMLWLCEGAASEPGVDLLLQRLTRLARVSAELSRAESVETVSKIVTLHSADAVAATTASLTLREGDDMLRLVALHGGKEGDAQKWATFSLHARTPLSDAVSTGKRIVATGKAEIAKRYPDLQDAARGERSLVSVPLHGRNGTIGALGLSLPGIQTLTSAELESFEILADTCAQALERIQAQDRSARQGNQLAFLADASAELATSLNHEATLSKVAQLAVPSFADWCAIDLVEDGRLRRLAVQHVDPAKVALAVRLGERYPSDPKSPRGPWNVMRTGRSQLIPVITDEMLVAGAQDEEHLRIARDLKLRSALTVPLSARGTVLGVMTWVWAESDRTYTNDDLTFAEDLGRRAAVAIDNAELYSQTLAASVRLQHAVLPEAMPVVAGWDISNYYQPSGRTEVGGDFYDVIRLEDGRMVLFVGDVMGSGVTAAVLMAQMRAAVRAFTAVDPTPQLVIHKLDLMFERYPTDQLVTLVYLVVDAARNELVMANAGHPAPVVLRRDRTSEQLPPADGSPLGTVPEDRRQVTLPFHAGDTILAFTDGLIERRDEDIDQGEHRLLKALPSLGQADLPAALTGLVEQLCDPTRDDDIAALAVRRST